MYWRKLHKRQLCCYLGVHTAYLDEKECLFCCCGNDELALCFQHPFHLLKQQTPVPRYHPNPALTFCLRLGAPCLLLRHAFAVQAYQDLRHAFPDL